MSETKNYGFTREGKPRGKPGPKPKSRSPETVKALVELAKTTMNESTAPNQGPAPTEVADNRLFYYSLSFTWTSASYSPSAPRTEVTASVYMGWKDSNITMPRILEAKRVAFGDRNHDDSVLVACCFLGLMTPETMRG